jgi:hypothetical protein
MKHGTRGLLLTASAWSAAAVLALLSVSGPAAAETRVCATITIDEPFVMPGGVEHAAGRLTLCRSLEYSPSRTVYVGYIDRAPVGMIFGQRGLSEAPTESDPYMMFARDRWGRLRLYGLSIPCREGMETFLFDGFPVAYARSPTALI